MCILFSPLNPPSPPPPRAPKPAPVFGAQPPARRTQAAAAGLSASINTPNAPSYLQSWSAMDRSSGLAMSDLSFFGLHASCAYTAI